jgi:hypothetical protein
MSASCRSGRFLSISPSQELLKREIIGGGHAQLYQSCTKLQESGQDWLSPCIYRLGCRASREAASVLEFTPSASQDSIALPEAFGQGLSRDRQHYFLSKTKLVLKLFQHCFRALESEARACAS